LGRFGHCLPQTTIIDDKPIPTEEVLQSDEDQGVQKVINAFAASRIGRPGQPCEPLPLHSDFIPVYGANSRGDVVVRDKLYTGPGMPGLPIGGITSSKKSSGAERPPIPGSELPGYMPLREDFDIEFDNDAELLLADMVFSDDDHPEDRRLKLQILRIYNSKLDERDERKRFVIDRGLVDFKAQQAADRRRSKEERDLVARLRVFSRFTTKEEHNAIVEGLLKARRLRKQIQLYQHYRHMGVRTLEQARQYENDRKKREIEIKARRQREDTPYLYSTGRTTAPASTNTKRATGKGRGRGAKDEEEEDESSSSSLVGANMTRAPGAQLLSDIELQLCTDLPMLPMHYLAVKDAITREAFRNGYLTLDGVNRVVSATESVNNSIFHFFVREMHFGDPSLYELNSNIAPPDDSQDTEGRALKRGRDSFDDANASASANTSSSPSQRAARSPRTDSNSDGVKAE
jgi:hypothetical protein